MTEAAFLPLDQLVRRLALLPERVMRRAEMARWLRFEEPERIVADIESLLRACLVGEPDARLTQLTLVDLLLHLEGDDALVLEALDLAANKAELPGTLALLSDHTPQRMIDDATRRSMRVDHRVPLGTRRSMARTADRAGLERLMADPDPMVIANLCANRSTREQDVVVMAARRPNFIEVLDTVARSRWLTNDAVRRALIQNPYVRPALAIGLLPQLDTSGLAALRHARQVHQAVRDAASYLLRLSPTFRA